MIVLPAVDLREGRCVQLVGGDYANEAVRLEDPVGVARDWWRRGFPWLHVVDLDAATGRGENTDLITDLLREAVRHGAYVQVGGGVRSRERIEALLEDGAARIVVGTRAIEDADWLREAADAYPGVLVVAADVRERQVVTRGWDTTVPRDVVDVVEALGEHPLAAVLVTAVHMEGRMAGTDLRLMEDVAQASAWPVLASGGVGSIGDLRALADTGVAGCVVGMALYTEALAPQAALDLMEDTE
jgi:phosphoribosylformimino-5-aminoimidazole carboxamide ribotide isomerase